MTSVFTRFRSEDDAKSAIGATIRWDGQLWRCVSHNDLGCLYWTKSNRPNGRLVHSESIDNVAGFGRVA